ncbi:hypothetical protein EQW78_11940 [Oerskovia turbata]|uniref:Lactococcin 972 family bacteriocin n=1 Tax=Oerskovia turbata TaxID=1713 RepID=A0A4Q1KSU8_9CELL|nr:hypothetical protein [Oerskovia turbata]RXR25721.1 hypothetical protein EQW73_09405 [Oerskovia turbata]RXR33191.1 hypothetical protein EQW78_11940 [Oerskovia turbata]
MKRKIMAVLTATVMAFGTSVLLGSAAQASAHIVWVSNGVYNCHVVAVKETRKAEVYSAGTSGSCVYGRAKAGYYTGGKLVYLTGSYGVSRSVVTVGPAFGFTSFLAAGGGFATPGPWKAY